MDDDEILEQGGADMSEDIADDGAFPFGISLRQKRFVEAFLQCANATEAAMVAGYSGNRKAMSVRGTLLLKSTRVLQFMQKLMMPEGGELTAEYLKSALHREALAGSNPTARVKALEILGRHAGLDTHRVAVDVYSHSSMDELLADMQTIKLREYDLRGGAFIENELLALLLIVTDRAKIEEALKLLPLRTDGKLLEHAAV